MIPSEALALILTVCLKIYLTESYWYCIISPGDRNLVKQSSRVVVVLNCTLHGELFDTVDWTINGQPVAEGHITTDPLRKKKWSAVFLTNVTSDKDLSVFKCVMRRGWERTSCDASPGKPKLRSLERVKIENSMESPTIGRCRADGWPIPHASWWRNGSQVFDGDFHASYIVTNPTDNESVLKIIDIEGDHHGMYTCRAENMFGTAEETVNVIVKRFDMIEWRPDLRNPVVALEGNNSTLECICQKDECRKETARAYWKFKDHHVNQSDRIKLSKVVTIGGVKITMTILNVSRIDEGEYFCGIKTSKGFGEKKRNLFVLTKVSDRFPHVRVTSSKEVYTDLYSTVWLKCEARYPSVLEKPVTFWFYNNTLLNAETVQHYHHNVYKPKARPNSTTILPFDLRITNVSSKDFGWYSCAVEFIVGEAKVHLSRDLKLAKKEDFVEDEKPIGTGSEESPLVAISSITAGGIIMGFVIAFVAYRLCRNKRNTEEPFFETPVDDHQFRYDVFVTFSSQDLNWVKKELIPLVEKHELNYCIHDRDFEIGKPVVDNMAQSVYTSRKVLAVMSHNYMSSKFCRGELEMALYRSTEMGDSSVIVMRIDGVDRSKLPKALRNRTFLDYHDFTERKNWEERLIKHLKPPPTEKCTENHSEKSYTLLQNSEV